MPKYVTQSEGQHHQLQWYSTVTIIFGDKNIDITTTTPSNSKIASELQVASLMLTKLKSIDDMDKTKLSSDITKLKLIPDTTKPKVIIKLNPTTFTCINLIDLENKPCFKKNISDHSLYIGFINSIHHSVDKYNTWHTCCTDDIKSEIVESNNNKLLYLIDGGIADLADHFMTVLTYPLVHFIKDFDQKYTINIISGDHAGWCTRACLEKVIKWNNLSNVEINNTAIIN